MAQVPPIMRDFPPMKIEVSKRKFTGPELAGRKSTSVLALNTANYILGQRAKPSAYWHHDGVARWTFGPQQQRDRGRHAAALEAYCTEKPAHFSGSPSAEAGPVQPGESPQGSPGSANVRRAGPMVRIDTAPYARGLFVLASLQLIDGRRASVALEAHVVRWRPRFAECASTKTPSSSRTKQCGLAGVSTGIDMRAGHGCPRGTSARSQTTLQNAWCSV